jgi:hypothetical protein
MGWKPTRDHPHYPQVADDHVRRKYFEGAWPERPDAIENILEASRVLLAK